MYSLSHARICSRTEVGAGPGHEETGSTLGNGVKQNGCVASYLILKPTKLFNFTIRSKNRRRSGGSYIKSCSELSTILAGYDQCPNVVVTKRPLRDARGSRSAGSLEIAFVCFLYIPCVSTVTTCLLISTRLLLVRDSRGFFGTKDTFLYSSSHFRCKLCPQKRKQHLGRREATLCMWTWARSMS